MASVLHITLFLAVLTIAIAYASGIRCFEAFRIHEGEKPTARVNCDEKDPFPRPRSFVKLNQVVSPTGKHFNKTHQGEDRGLYKFITCAKWTKDGYSSYGCSDFDSIGCNTMAKGQYEGYYYCICGDDFCNGASIGKATFGILLLGYIIMKACCGV